MKHDATCLGSEIGYTLEREVASVKPGQIVILGGRNNLPVLLRTLIRKRHRRADGGFWELNFADGPPVKLYSDRIGIPVTKFYGCTCKD